MKFTYLTLFSVLILVGCATQTEEAGNDAQALFEENSKTIMAMLEGWQAESIDYDAIYSDDFMLIPTGLGSPDSMSLDDMKKSDIRNWEALDFKLLSDPITFLPGVSADTKQADGSVRFYGLWEVSVAATDSTEAKSAIIKTYHSYDFDEEGKIRVQQFYGDTGGLARVLFDEDEEDSEEEEEEEEGDTEE